MLTPDDNRMSAIVVDTSVVVAVIGNEATKSRLVELAKDAELIAPPTLPWEIANALSSMFKRRLIPFDRAVTAINEYRRIRIQFVDVPLQNVITLCSELDIYSYDACMIACARVSNAPLITVDRGLRHAAKRAGIQLVEVPP